jgi:hypothetical protein
MKQIRLVLIAGLLALPALASTVYAPANCQTTPVPVATNDCTGGVDASAAGSLSTDIQEIISSSLFSGPVLLTSVALRPNPNAGAPGGVNTVTSATVAMTLGAQVTATSPSAGCTALPTQAGCNTTLLPTGGETTLFNGSATFTTTNTGTPRGFDFLVTFTTPFLYNPANGNLQFDLILPGNAITNVSPGGGVLSFEAVAGSNRQSTVGGVLALAGSSTGSAISGLVLQLSGTPQTPTPEPSTFLMLGGGLLGLVFFARKRATR